MRIQKNKKKKRTRLRKKTIPPVSEPRNPRSQREGRDAGFRSLNVLTAASYLPVSTNSIRPLYGLHSAPASRPARRMSSKGRRASHMPHFTPTPVRTPSKQVHCYTNVTLAFIESQRCQPPNTRQENHPTFGGFCSLVFLTSHQACDVTGHAHAQRNIGWEDALDKGHSHESANK